jgi:hypothetical protein
MCEYILVTLLGESTTSSMRKEGPSPNGFYLNKDNINPTFDTLTEEDRKALEAYCVEVDELFFSRYEVVKKDAVPVIIRKAEVTLEV